MNPWTKNMMCFGRWLSLVRKFKKVALPFLSSATTSGNSWSLKTSRTGGSSSGL